MALQLPISGAHISGQRAGHGSSSGRGSEAPLDEVSDSQTAHIQLGRTRNRTCETLNTAVDQLEVSYNGEDLDFGSTSSWTSPDGAFTLNRIGAANAVDLVVKEKMGVALTLVPMGKEENRIHKYGITGEDCFAHFGMQVRFYNLSSHVNGVLGQTYQPGFVNSMKRGVAMPIMGGADRFLSSSLVATDCKSSQYTASVIEEGSAMPSFTAVCGSSGLP